MKLYFCSRLILILFLILPLNAIQNDTSAVYAVGGYLSASAERYLKFENWVKLSRGQKLKVITGYLSFLRTDGPAQIPATDRSSARKIIRNTSPDDFLAHINKTYAGSERTLSAHGIGVDTVILQYVKNRLETVKNYNTLLLAARYVSEVKNTGNKEDSVRSKYDEPQYPERHNNVFDTPQYWFSYDWWQRQDQNEKKALVTGYVAFLNILVKTELCFNEEEKRQYDLFCKLVTVNDLVNHVDSFFKNPLYRDEGAQILIYNYMTDNFLNYIGEPFTLPG